MKLVKAAKPRFNDHHQPKIPVWGYFNEADPTWAAKEIDLAADQRYRCIYLRLVLVQIPGPYLKDGLEKGF